MVEVDQAMRERNMEDGSWDEEVDVKNTEKMRGIIERMGWPTITKVGKECAHNVWLLVQHADHDVAFQEYCLQLMKEAPENEVDKTDIAYLEDRVRLSQGKRQLYGTQFIREDNKFVPRDIEDEANVDERRAEAGMSPLSEQIQHMHEKYKFDENK